MPRSPVSAPVFVDHLSRRMRRVAKPRMRAATAAAVAGLLGAMFASPAAAQSPSILSLLPVQDQSLQVGSEVTGTLSSSDYLSTNDAYLDAWALTGRVGTRVTVDLRSSDFDVVLYAIGPGLGETLYDDDSGAGCDARLTFTFLEDGPYRVVATAIGGRQTGTYTLAVTDRPQSVETYACGEQSPSAMAALPTDDRVLALGSEASGSFDFLTSAPSGRPVEAWMLQAVGGEPMSIILESDDFDAYLYLLGPGIDGIMSDDDGAGGLNSQIEFTAPADGPYKVIASALGEGSTGRYTIRVEAPRDLATLEPGGFIEVGSEVQGFMSSDSEPLIADGRRGMVWAVEGTAGQRVTIDLTSDDFDAFLYVAGPGLDQPLTDDDGGGSLNSRLTLTFPESGTYRVIATALESEFMGSYTLTISPM